MAKPTPTLKSAPRLATCRTSKSTTDSAHCWLLVFRGLHAENEPAAAVGACRQFLDPQEIDGGSSPARVAVHQWDRRVHPERASTTPALDRIRPGEKEALTAPKFAGDDDL